MQLVDKQNDPAVAGLDLVEDRLQPLLKLATVFCTRDQRAHIQRKNCLVAQRFRHVATYDALGKPLRNGGFADARLADEAGVILGFARENADDVSDFVVPPNYGIQFVLAGALHQVIAVFFQRFISCLGVVGGDAGIAANRGQRLQIGVAFYTKRLKQAFQRRIWRFYQCKQQVFHRNILVAQPAGVGLGAV
ncbi:hypothetical protein DSECCO2_652460 [anaerobic digester metagenome]